MTEISRTMTQAEYDAIPPQQREFYDRLAREGRIRIVPDHAPPRDKMEGGQVVGKKKPDLIERLKGKAVMIRLADGFVLEGTLTEISKFEVVVYTDGRDVVVLKHALMTLEEVRAQKPVSSPLVGEPPKIPAGVANDV